MSLRKLDGTLYGITHASMNRQATVLWAVLAVAKACIILKYLSVIHTTCLKPSVVLDIRISDPRNPFRHIRTKPLPRRVVVAPLIERGASYSTTAIVPHDYVHISSYIGQYWPLRKLPYIRRCPGWPERGGCCDRLGKRCQNDYGTNLCRAPSIVARLTRTPFLLTGILFQPDQVVKQHFDKFHLQIGRLWISRMLVKWCLNRQHQ